MRPERPPRARAWPALGRLLLFLILWFVLQVIFLAVLFAVLAATGALQPTWQMDLAWAAGPAALAAVAGVLLLQRFARGPSLGALGLRWQGGKSWRESAIGLALGPLLFLAIFLLQWAAGWLTAGLGRLPPGPALEWLAILALVALGEELVVRGYALQQLKVALGTLPAVLISSVFWGLLHVTNPNVTALALFNISAAGLLFAYAYLITRSLWLPIALHLSWNYGQAVIFGYPVSGFETPSLLQPTVSGPNWITGGAFGPEGGVLVLAALGLGGALLWGWGRRRGAREGREGTR